MYSLAKPISVYFRFQMFSIFMLYFNTYNTLQDKEQKYL